MKKVHLFSNQPLHESLYSPGMGIYWFLAPCGVTVTVRASKWDVGRGAVERRLRDAWESASAEHRCAKCAKRGA